MDCLIIRLTWGNGKIHFRHDYYLRRRPWHQASVVSACFDVGSAFLGYTLAVLPVSAALVDPRLALAGVLLVWPFVFDTTFTLLRR